MKQVKPLSKYQALRLLSAQLRQSAANEYALQHQANPELSINRFLNKMIETGLAVTHHDTASDPAQKRGDA